MTQILRINPPRIPEWWSHVREGVQLALDNSQNFRSMDSIYDELASGNWVLWVAVDKDELLGAAITEVISTEQGMYCCIPFAYSADPKRRDVVGIFLEYIEQASQKFGFRGVKFVSSRSGYERRAKALGYTRGFVEYRKEFN